MAEGGLSLSSLSCPICFEEYNISKVPKVLLCGHTFCYQCLSNMVDYRCGFIRCPTCRMDNFLPQSSKVQDFSTNFALLELADREVQNQNKIKTVQASFMQRDAAGLKCPQHKNPMKFYCETCKIQVCHQCLLGDHKLGQHCVISAADAAANLSDQLQRSTENLQCYEQEKQVLGDKINEAIENCQQDKVRLQGVVQQNLQKGMQKLQEAATKMLNQIDEETEALSHVYADLQQQYLHTNTLHDQIKEKCSTLKQNFQQVDLSQSAELEHTDQLIDKFKNLIDSLKAGCQSTPANVNLVIYSAHCEMGITLGHIAPERMILQATDVQNGNNSPHGNNAGGQRRVRAVPRYPMSYLGHSHNFFQAQPLISNE